MTRMVLLFSVILCSCMHKPQYQLAPATAATTTSTAEPTCDSMSISYYKDIQPIFRTNCYGCHSTAVVTGGGLNLEDTGSLKTYLKKDFRGDGVYGSMLYHCLLHSQNAQRMPPTYVLDSCSLHKIHHWLSISAPIQ